MQPKIGDKVKVVDNRYNGFKKGQIVKVVRIFETSKNITCEGEYVNLEGERAAIWQILSAGEYILIEQ